MRASCVVRILLIAAALAALGGCERGGATARFVGTLERDRIEVAAEAAEPIVALEVREGERVAAGRLLVRQETAVAQARLARAAAQVAEARHRLAELEKGARREEIDEARARVAAARAALVRDARELERIERLVESNVLAETELDRARAARDGAQAGLEESDARLTALLRGTRAEQLGQARAAVAAAEGALRELQVGAERLLVRAPRSGLVEALPYEVGERPPVGHAVAVLLADGAPFARIYVPEPARVHVHAGAPARVFVDGIAEALPGRVRYVASDASFTPYYALTQRDRSRLVFLAEVALEGAEAARLPAGVPVEVEIEGASGG